MFCRGIIPLQSHSGLKEDSYFVKFTINQHTPAESNPLAGMVISQAVMISSATLQRTLLTRSEEPTPMIAELTICKETLKADYTLKGL